MRKREVFTIITVFLAMLLSCGCMENTMFESLFVGQHCDSIHINLISGETVVVNAGEGVVQEHAGWTGPPGYSIRWYNNNSEVMYTSNQIRSLECRRTT